MKKKIIFILLYLVGLISFLQANINNENVIDKNNIKIYSKSDIIKILSNTTWRNSKKEYLYQTNTWWSFKQDGDNLTCRTCGDILYDPSMPRKDFVTQLIDIINEDKINVAITENGVTLSYKAYVAYGSSVQNYDIEIVMIILSDEKIEGTIKMSGQYTPLTFRKCVWKNCTYEK